MTFWQIDCVQSLISVKNRGQKIVCNTFASRQIYATQILIIVGDDLENEIYLK